MRLSNIECQCFEVSVQQEVMVVSKKDKKRRPLSAIVEASDRRAYTPSEVRIVGVCRTCSARSSFSAPAASIDRVCGR